MVKERIGFESVKGGAVTLFDQFGRPVKRGAKTPPVRRPLAAAPIADAWREYVASGLTPVKLAALFKEADTGEIRRQAELFDQMEERDGHIIGEISKRRNVILDVDFQVTPASEDSNDVKIAEAVEEMFDGITDWADVLVSLQDAVGKGFSAIEMKWTVSEGQAWVEQFKFIEQKRFLFYDIAGILSTVPRLITDENPLGIEIPPWKTLFHRYGGKSGHPTRSGLYRVCTWWYLFKNYAIKDWVRFCEVYGMPLRLGKYDSGSSSDDRDALEIAVRSLGSDAAGIISKSTEIEFVEASKGASGADLYKGITAFANKEISKAILGSTLTADVDGKGSYAAANTHNEVRLDLLRSDARAIAATIRDQLIRPFVGFNFGWDASVPKYEGIFEEPEDLRASAEIIDKLSDRMDIPQSWVRKKFSIPEPEKGEECLGRKPSIPSLKTKEAASLPSPHIDADDDPLDPFLARLDRDAAPTMEQMLQTVRELMDQVDSLEELREILLDAWDGMDSDAFGDLMAMAMSAAELMGRFEVTQE